MADVASITGVSRQQVNNWIRKGRLPATRDPRTHRYEVTRQALQRLARVRPGGTPRALPAIQWDTVPWALNTADVATLLGMCRVHVRLLIRMGRLRARDDAGVYSILRDDLQLFVAERAQQVAAAA